MALLESEKAAVAARRSALDALTLLAADARALFAWAFWRVPPELRRAILDGVEEEFGSGGSISERLALASEALRDMLVTHVTDTQVDMPAPPPPPPPQPPPDLSDAWDAAAGVLELIGDEGYARIAAATHDAPSERHASEGVSAILRAHPLLEGVAVSDETALALVVLVGGAPASAPPPVPDKRAPASWWAEEGDEGGEGTPPSSSAASEAAENVREVQAYLDALKWAEWEEEGGEGHAVAFSTEWDAHGGGFGWQPDVDDLMGAYGGGIKHGGAHDLAGEGNSKFVEEEGEGAMQLRLSQEGRQDGTQRSAAEVAAIQSGDLLEALHSAQAELIVAVGEAEEALLAAQNEAIVAAADAADAAAAAEAEAIVDREEGCLRAVKGKPPPPKRALAKPPTVAVGGGLSPSLWAPHSSTRGSTQQHPRVTATPSAVGAKSALSASLPPVPRTVAPPTAAAWHQGRVQRDRSTSSADGGGGYASASGVDAARADAARGRESARAAGSAVRLNGAAWHDPPRRKPGAATTWDTSPRPALGSPLASPSFPEPGSSWLVGTTGPEMILSGGDLHKAPSSSLAARVGAPAPAAPLYVVPPSLDPTALSRRAPEGGVNPEALALARSLLCTCGPESMPFDLEANHSLACVDAHYTQARAHVRSLVEQRAALLHAAASSYKSGGVGGSSIAGHKAAQARELTRRIFDANTLVAHALLLSRNRGMAAAAVASEARNGGGGAPLPLCPERSEGDGSLPPGYVSVDLHGQHVREALRLLRAQVLPAYCRPSIRGVLVITGAGNHSETGVSKLRHGVGEYLRRIVGEPITGGMGVLGVSIRGRGAFLVHIGSVSVSSQRRT